jgi:8-oxo-dGTP pyrophosphatase MutT (NUDIX family)
MMPFIESFGVVPLQKIDGIWHVFLILHKEGHHWGFPKGRKNPGEDALQAAKRELFEETGLQVVRLLCDKPLIEKYRFRHQRRLQYKKVCYYIAEVDGTVQLQPEEIREGKWLPLDSARDVLSFAEAKAICDEALKLLDSKEV